MFPQPSYYKNNCTATPKKSMLMSALCIVYPQRSTRHIHHFISERINNRATLTPSELKITTMAERFHGATIITVCARLRNVTHLKKRAAEPR